MRTINATLQAMKVETYQIMSILDVRIPPLRKRQVSNVMECVKMKNQFCAKNEEISLVCFLFHVNDAISGK